MKLATVWGLCLAMVGCTATASPGTPAPRDECVDAGQGITPAIDWSPNGSWLAMARSNADLTTSIFRRGMSGSIELVATGADILDFVVAVDDSGAVYYERSGQPATLARSTGAATSSWQVPLLAAVEVTPTQLLGLQLDPGATSDLGTLLALTLAPSARSAQSQPLGAWKGAVSLAADGSTLVVGVMPAVGGPVTFESAAGQPGTVTVAADAGPAPIALVARPTDWLVFYGQPSTSRVVSSTSTGLAGPTITGGGPILAFDVTPAGRYATSSKNGPNDSSTVCFGSLGSMFPSPSSSAN